MTTAFHRVDQLIATLKRNWVRNVQDKHKRWWMEIVIPNDVCLEPSEEIKKVGSNDIHPHVLIPITWDNVMKYGKYAVHKVRQYGAYDDTLLRRDMHDVRKAMANALQKLCKSECVWEIVGSDSTVSDVDINVFDDRVDILKPLLQQHIHSWVDGNQIDTLFDMNIYLSAFGRKELSKKAKKRQPYVERIPFSPTVNYVFIVPPHTQQYQTSQLIWTFVHLVDETEGTLNERDVNEYINKSIWSDEWKKAKDLRNLLHRRKGNVDKTIVALVKDAQNVWNDIVSKSPNEDVVEQYMNILSTIQFYSRETYLSRGAYFHVVMEMSNGVKNLNLQPFEYVHSIIDNVSFIAELCKKDSLCPIQYSTIFAKISKYLYRVCDALIKYGVLQHNTWDIVAIRESASALNTMRKKTNIDPTVVGKQMQELHSLIGVPFHGDDIFTNMDLAVIFSTCLRIALNPLSHSTVSQTPTVKSHTKRTKTQCSKNRCTLLDTKRKTVMTRITALY